MIWEIDNIPNEHYSVTGQPAPNVFDGWQVVKNDHKGYKVLHWINDQNKSWHRGFLDGTFWTVDEAISALWKAVPMDGAVYGIKKEQFRELKRRHYPDSISTAISDHVFNGKICKYGEWCGFASVLTGDYSKGTSLIFEHIHFEII